MTEIKFKGKELQIPEIGQFWIPTARVELISERRNYFCEVVVDSGADITLIPRSLGEFLGLSFTGKRIREIRGIGERTIPYIITNFFHFSSSLRGVYAPGLRRGWF